MDRGERMGYGSEPGPPYTADVERIMGLEAQLNYCKEQLSSYEASSARSRQGDGGSTYRSTNGPTTLGPGSRPNTSRTCTSACSSASGSSRGSRLSRGGQSQIRPNSSRAAARSSAVAAEAAIDAVRRSQPPAPFYHDELGNKVHVQELTFQPPAPSQSSSDRAIAPGRAAANFRAADPAAEREAKFRHQQERVRSTSKARAFAVDRCEDPDRAREEYFAGSTRGGSRSPMGGMDLHKRPPPLMAPANQYYATPVYENHLVEEEKSEASPKHTARSGYSQCSSHFAHHTRSGSPNNHVFPPALLLARQASPRSRSRGGYTAGEASECRATSYTACSSYSPANYRHLPKRLARGRVGGKQKNAGETGTKRPMWYEQRRYKEGEGVPDSPRSSGGPPFDGPADTLNPSSSRSSCYNDD